MFKRSLNLIKLPARQSAFLWGARQTGKSFYLKKHFHNSIYYDLLQTHEALRLIKAPSLLREELLAAKADNLAYPVIIDEIQKAPSLLDEVHWLIENAGISFILCGSSAKKLKSQSVNLLGGRAWPFYCFPLSYNEIPEFDLLKALKHGLIPNHYLAKEIHLVNFHQSYVDVYLTDEIRNEGLVRNLPAFAQFLDLVGLTNGEMINATNIARDCGIDRATVKSYYQILIDTLLGYFIYPFSKKIKRDIITSMPKFYLFDIGIANYLSKQMPQALNGSVTGKSFEHFILMELKAYASYCNGRSNITYWRTKSGLEVDFIIDGKIAIEVKISKQVCKQDLNGLIAFCSEHKGTRAIVVSQDMRKRILQIDDGLIIEIMPWREFLDALWNKEIILS